MALPDDADRYTDQPGRRRDDEHYSDRPPRRDDDFDYGDGGRFRRRDVPNHLTAAILCTLFCCWPAGVVAIVYAAQVNGKLGAGDYEGAVQASNTAKTWCWVSFAGSLVIVAFYIVVIAAGGMR